MFCCWLRTCRVRSLHKGIALLRGFCMRRLHLTFSCAADRLCRAARSGDAGVFGAALGAAVFGALRCVSGGCTKVLRCCADSVCTVCPCALLL